MVELREDDLFTLAGSLSELLGAPVTIEDPDTTVLAYSGGAQAVDDARIGTILGRQVPSEYRRMLADAGVFERLRTDDDVVYVDLGKEQMTPRAVIAVRDHDDLLGSIWAAVHAPPTAHQESVLRSAAPVVAEAMLRERDRSGSANRRSAHHMEQLLTGGDRAVRTADELGMRGRQTVAAVARRDPGEPVSSRMLGSVRLHLSAVCPGSLVAELDDRVYVAAPVEESGMRRILADYLTRARNLDDLLACVGRAVASVAEA
ncbi:MAG TPA: PucR family transcriptional regulator, partial [Bacillota bacterium]|nr:PucR family transcriptional regulator [Bacillota bacterium]